MQYIPAEDVLVHRVGTVQDYRDKVEEAQHTAEGKVARPPVLGSLREALGRPVFQTMREALGLLS